MNLGVVMFFFLLFSLRSSKKSTKKTHLFSLSLFLSSPSSPPLPQKKKRNRLRLGLQDRRARVRSAGPLGLRQRRLLPPDGARDRLGELGREPLCRRAGELIVFLSSFFFFSGVFCNVFSPFHFTRIKNGRKRERARRRRGRREWHAKSWKTRRKTKRRKREKERERKQKKDALLFFTLSLQKRQCSSSLPPRLLLLLRPSAAWARA